MLPKDPVILLSFVNTKLRDEFASLEELCAALDADAQTLCDTLAVPVLNVLAILRRKSKIESSKT